MNLDQFVYELEHCRGLERCETKGSFLSRLLSAPCFYVEEDKRVFYCCLGGGQPYVNVAFEIEHNKIKKYAFKIESSGMSLIRDVPESFLFHPESSLLRERLEKNLIDEHSPGPLSCLSVELVSRKDQLEMLEVWGKSSVLAQQAQHEADEALRTRIKEMLVIDNLSIETICGNLGFNETTLSDFMSTPISELESWWFKTKEIKIFGFIESELKHPFVNPKDLSKLVNEPVSLVERVIESKKVQLKTRGSQEKISQRAKALEVLYSIAHHKLMDQGFSTVHFKPFYNGKADFITKSAYLMSFVFPKTCKFNLGTNVDVTCSFKIEEKHTKRHCDYLVFMFPKIKSFVVVYNNTIDHYKTLTIKLGDNFPVPEVSMGKILSETNEIQRYVWA